MYVRVRRTAKCLTVPIWHTQITTQDPIPVPQGCQPHLSDAAAGLVPAPHSPALPCHGPCEAGHPWAYSLCPSQWRSLVPGAAPVPPWLPGPDLGMISLSPAWRLEIHQAAPPGVPVTLAPLISAPEITASNFEKCL